MNSHHYLRNVDAFYLHGGGTIENIKQLGQAFQEMGEEAYAHHVSSDRNDFAAWVRRCVHDKHLANKIRTAADRQEAKNIVQQRVSQLTHFPSSTRITRSKNNPIMAEEPKAPAEFKMHEVIRDIELLASSLSTESFLKAYAEKDFRQARREGSEDVRESNAGLLVLQKTENIPRSLERDFLTKLNTLINMVELKEVRSAKQLYNALKDEFEAREFSNDYKKTVHKLLMNCYEDIKKME